MPMCKYAMINFYAESIDGNVGERTIDHHVDVLERTFRQMEQFGVTMEDSAIPGLSGANLQRWMNFFKKDHKPTTVNNTVVTLNPFLRWAHTIYPDTVPDFSNVLHTMRLPDPDKIPVEERPKDKYYTDEEIAALLKVPIPSKDSPQKKRDRAVIALFLASGMRVSELCSLKIGDIRQHERGSVFVRRKGGAWKNVDVADFAYKYIDAYLATRKDRKDMDAPLFMTSHGCACSPEQLYKAMRTKQNKAGISEDKARGNHVFRHSFVSAVEKIGGGAVARDLANHKSLVVTNRYDHSTAEQRRNAVNALAWGK